MSALTRLLELHLFVFDVGVRQRVREKSCVLELIVFSEVLCHGLARSKLLNALHEMPVKTE